MMGIQLIGSPTGHANSWSTQKIQSRQGMKTWFRPENSMCLF